MTLFKHSLVALALAGSTSALAQSFAITNATLYTATDKGVMENATVVVTDGKISAINPTTLQADTVIDAQNAIVTPGFIGSMNGLGLVEVGAVSDTRDASDEKAGIDFDPSLAFNPKSTLIPYARKGGITRDLLVPGHSKDIFAGLASVVDLSGNMESLVQHGSAMVVNLGETSKGSRALKLQTLINKLQGQIDKLEEQKAKKDDKKDDKKNGKKPTEEETILTRVVNGELPLIVTASRAADLHQLLKVKQRFGVKLIIAGADDAVVVKDELAKAEVPVIISAMSDLPGSFDSLHASLDNAGKLEQAGVKVILTIKGDSAHNLYQLRFDAGNAVSYGMSREAALKAISANVADVFGLDSGRISEGQAADLVLWSADPFELSSHVTKIWINGVEVSTEARQDKLRERYTTQSEMPVGYTK